MHATLIFPGITSCGWNCFGKVNNSEAQFVPHGLAYIAAYARSEGHSIDVLDLRRLSGWDEFSKKIRERSPGVFGISSMSVDFGNALEAIKIIKELDSKSTVILGGVHASVAFDDASADNRIDYIVRGEGEVSFSRLLSFIEKGERAERIINGIVPDINALPFPERHLFGFEEGEMKFPWLTHMPAPFVSIIASRGCPHQCTFCQPAERAIFGGKARIRTVENVIDELKYLRDRYQFKSLLVHDDFFAFNPQWVERFCEEYKKNGFNQIFTCQVRSDFIVNNRDLVARMADSGLSCFMIGFESGSRRILDFIRKGTTVEMNKKAVEICRVHGIKIFANYMFGLPSETPAEVFETIDFIRWARPDYPSPAFFTPHPGTELYEYCRKHELSLIQTYKGYARNPTEPKIKGVDYQFLNFAVHRSAEYKHVERLAYLESLPASEQRERAVKELLEAKKKIADLDIYYKSKYLIANKDKTEDLSFKNTVQKKERVLVTGGTGFIGAALVQKLMEKGYPVGVLTRSMNNPRAGYLAARGAQLIQGVVEDINDVGWLKGYDIVCHLAVFQGTEGAKMFDVNVRGTENVVRAALKNNVKKFIYASSIEAQGTTSDIMYPLSEAMDCRPVSDYGLSKYEGEKIVQKYMENDGLNAIIARIGNVYGAGGLSFIHAMSAAIIEGNALLTSLPFIGERIVQPIYIDDLVNAFVSCIEGGGGMSGIFNFTGHQPITIEEWFRELAAILGLEENADRALNEAIDETRIPELRKAHPQVNYFLSGDTPNIHRFFTDSKLVGEIGDYQSYSLPKGIACTLEWYYKMGVFNAYI